MDTQKGLTQPDDRGVDDVISLVAASDQAPISVETSVAPDYVSATLEGLSPEDAQKLQAALDEATKTNALPTPTQTSAEAIPAQPIKAEKKLGLDDFGSLTQAAEHFLAVHDDKNAILSVRRDGAIMANIALDKMPKQERDAWLAQGDHAQKAEAIGYVPAKVLASETEAQNLSESIPTESGTDNLPEPKEEADRLAPGITLGSQIPQPSEQASSVIAPAETTDDGSSNASAPAKDPVNANPDQPGIVSGITIEPKVGLPEPALVEEARPVQRVPEGVDAGIVTVNPNQNESNAADFNPPKWVAEARLKKPISAAAQTETAVPKFVRKTPADQGQKAPVPNNTAPKPVETSATVKISKPAGLNEIKPPKVLANLFGLLRKKPQIENGVLANRPEQTAEAVGQANESRGAVQQTEANALSINSNVANADVAPVENSNTVLSEAENLARGDAETIASTAAGVQAAFNNPSYDVFSKLATQHAEGSEQRGISPETLKDAA